MRTTQRSVTALGKRMAYSESLYWLLIFVIVPLRAHTKLLLSMSSPPGSKENQSANQKETGPVSLITSHYSLCLLCIVCVFFIHLFLKHLEICMWEHFTERYSHLCTCMLMISLFVPCHICKALASKKKSKSRKVSKPAKQEGRTHAHCHLFFFFIYLVESVHASTMSNLFFYSCSCCCSKTKNK